MESLVQGDDAKKLLQQALSGQIGMDTEGDSKDDDDDDVLGLNEKPKEREIVKVKRRPPPFRKSQSEPVQLAIDTKDDSEAPPQQQPPGNYPIALAPDEASKLELDEKGLPVIKPAGYSTTVALLIQSVLDGKSYIYNNMESQLGNACCEFHYDAYVFCSQRDKDASFKRYTTEELGRVPDTIAD